MDAESAVSIANGSLNLEPSVTIKAADLDALGENFEKTTKGFVDFLLLDAKGFPLIVLCGRRREHVDILPVWKC